MATKKKMLQAAAGIVAGGEAAEGVSFDGTNDYLSRATALTGAGASRTATISFWIYGSDTGLALFDVSSYGSKADIDLRIKTFHYLLLTLASPTDYQICGVNGSSADSLFENTWHHVIFSVDLDGNGVNSPVLHFYVDDNQYNNQTFVNTSYLSEGIDLFTPRFAQGLYIGKSHTDASESNFKGRLAHFFMDSSYYDLSVEANRRLFITDDLKPADDLASQSPILYLPMTDADTAGTNLGTGGDFTVNGTLDTAQRGPNQWNCVATEFDGNIDILYNDSTGLLDTKVISFSANFRVDVYPVTGHVLYVGSSSGGRRFVVYLNSTGLIVEGFNSSNVTILKVTYPKASVVLGKHYSFQFSCDLTDTQKRHFILDGVDLDSDVTWNTYTDDSIGFNGTYDTVAVGALRNGSPTGNPLDAGIGEVYLDTTYIDLAADNPFLDSDTNKPKPVRQVLDDTGNTPVIAMPIQAGNAGLNLGTGGGSFTAYSAPYEGARGWSEYWARSVDDSGSASNNLTLSTSASLTPSNSFTCVFAGKPRDSKLLPLSISSSFFRFASLTSGLLITYGTALNTGYLTPALTNDAWNLYHVSYDGDTQTLTAYKNGTTLTGSITSATSNTVDLSSQTLYAINNPTVGTYDDHETGFIYFSTEYVDFSQESNRNLFVDQLGYPKDLTPAIDAGDIPSPLVYMKFDDPDDLGANSGTGGDFTINGTIVQGADVDPNA